MRCEETVKILEILRLSEKGHTQRDIAASIGCAKSTVGEILRRSRGISLNYRQAQSLSSETLQERIYPALKQRQSGKAQPDFAAIHTRLNHRHMNLQYLWEAYELEQRENGMKPLRYSQFCLRYRQWAKTAGKSVTMRQEREGGKELFVDWMGDVLPLVIDQATGEIQNAHFFVTTLGDSGYPYVEAFPDEKQEHWLLAHSHAFTYYGGLPRVLVPDNCKTAMTSPKRYDPVINPAYWELAKHYDVAVIPARVREPQDKASVEEGVRWLETWLLGWLHNQRFFSFGELNQAVQNRLRELVRRPYQKRPGNRLSAFEELDQPYLRPLQVSPFEAAEMKVRRVPDNYHVEWDGFYYSVPFGFYRQKVTLRATSTSIEIFDADRNRIASHPRRRSGKRYVSDPAHMPQHHRAQWDSNQWNGTRYRQWARQIGAETFGVVDRMLAAHSIEEQAYKSCMGLLQLAKKHSPERLENACRRAITLRSETYTTIANILKNGQDLLMTSTIPVRSTPVHGNVRGAAAFM